MKKVNLMLFAAAATLSLSAAQKNMSLEWNKSYPANTVYEVELDRSKLEKLAGIPQSSAYTVTAKVNGKKQKLATTAYPGKKQNSIALRFTVPAGTTALACAPAKGELEIKDAAKNDNLFAGALDAKNVKNWKLSNGIAISAIDGGIRLDSKTLGKSVSASYTVDIPAEAAGRPVKLELDVKSVSKMAWPNTVYIAQLDADGKELPEYVTDHRWISQMRPTNILTPYRENGFIRPDTKKLKIYFGLYSYSAGFDNHGLPLKNKDDITPHLEIKRIVLRSAEQLPFPKYNDIFFAQGVTDDKDDKAISLKDDRMLFFSTRSTAMWGGQAREIRNEKEFYFPTGDGTVEVFIKPKWTAKNKTYVLFDARSFLLRSGRFRKNGNNGRKTLYSLGYAPAQKLLTLNIQDADEITHSISGKVDIAEGKWSHIASQWSQDNGLQFFLDGKKVIDSRNTQDPKAMPAGIIRKLSKFIVEPANSSNNFSTITLEWSAKGITAFVDKSKVLKLSAKDLAAGKNSVSGKLVRNNGKTCKLDVKCENNKISVYFDGKELFSSDAKFLPLEIAKEQTTALYI